MYSKYKRNNASWTIKVNPICYLSIKRLKLYHDSPIITYNKEYITYFVLLLCIFIL